MYNFVLKAGVFVRVITGTARGVRLLTPEGTVVRPTTDKVKESIFNIIQFDIEGRRVLDLFAGSGQLGIEALSRGAESCTFVDSSKKSLDLVSKNLFTTHLNDKASLRCADYSLFIEGCRDTFDIIFLDPPYSTDILQRAIKKVAKVISDFGIIVCEHPTTQEIAPPDDSFEIKNYKYGKITLSVFRKQA